MKISRCVEVMANDKVGPFWYTLYTTDRQRQVASGPYSNSQAQSNIVQNAHTSKTHE